MEPGPGAQTTTFVGLEQQPIAPSTVERPLLYEVSLDSEAGSLAGGDPVTLRGFTVGEVRDVGFAYDPATGELVDSGDAGDLPVAVPRRGVARATPSAAESSAEIAHLIGKGMRARLSRSPPLVGSYQVSLEMVPGAQPTTGPLTTAARRAAADPGRRGRRHRAASSPASTRCRSSRSRTTCSSITSHVDALTSSPKLKDAVAQLDAALRQIHSMTAKAGPQVPVVIARLRRAAADLDGTAKSANRMLSGTATQNGLADTIQEITRPRARCARWPIISTGTRRPCSGDEEATNDVPADCPRCSS